MNKQDLWNRITSNGCREMTEERFYQALDELQSEAIPATERERVIAVAYEKYRQREKWEIGHVNDHTFDWPMFLETDFYKSIPPASTTVKTCKNCGQNTMQCKHCDGSMDEWIPKTEQPETFEQELERQFEKISIKEAMEVNKKTMTHKFMDWIKEQLLKGKQ